MNGKKIVVVYPGRLLPITGGGAARARSMIDYMRSNGAIVHTITANHYSATQRFEETVDRSWVYTTSFGQQWIDWQKTRCSGARRFFWALAGGVLFPFLTGLQYLRLKRYEHRRRELRKQKKMSFLERSKNELLIDFTTEVCRKIHPDVLFMNFVFNVDVFDNIPKDILRLVDTHDVQHCRASVASASGGNLADRACSKQEEVALLQKANALLAISHEDKASFEDLDLGVPVALALQSMTCHERLLAPKESKSLLFVGNNYDPNNLGINRFLSDVWPTLRGLEPGAELYVCGNVCKAVQGAHDGVHLEGVVDDLKPYYEQAAIVLNLAPYGTGLPIKTVEALGYGKCVVSTHEACRKFLNLGDCPVVTGDFSNFADILFELLSAPEKRRSIELDSFSFAVRHFHPQACYANVARLINEWEGAAN